MAAWRATIRRIARSTARTRAVVTPILALVLTACAAPGASSSAVAPGPTVASASPSASPAPSHTVDRDALFECPEYGGRCLGPIEAGTYTTRVFKPAITYTVPDGWENREDLLGNFLLQIEDDDRYLGIYRDIAVPQECEEAPEPGIGQTPAELAEWLTSHPGLVTSEPEQVSIGGLDGLFVDISLDPGWTTVCPYSGGQPVVPFIIGGGVSGLHHVILPGFEERLYLLEYEGGNVAIEVGPEGSSLDEYLTEVQPIIESLEFSTNG